MLKSILSLAFALLLSTHFALLQTTKDQDEFEWVRRNLATTPNYIPKAGIVPDSTTAIAIAYAVSVPVYGKKQIDGELPLRADLRDGLWTILGTLNCKSCDGGTVIVQIEKATGRIVRISHSQ